MTDEGGLDIHSGEVIGLIVNSQCDYFSPVAYPDQLEGGFRVSRLGNSSVEYGIAIFKIRENEACAASTFTHVIVGRESRGLPEQIVLTTRKAVPYSHSCGQCPFQWPRFNGDQLILGR